MQTDSYTRLYAMMYLFDCCQNKYSVNENTRFSPGNLYQTFSTSAGIFSGTYNDYQGPQGPAMVTPNATSKYIEISNPSLTVLIPAFSNYTLEFDYQWVVHEKTDIHYSCTKEGRHLSR